MNYVVICCTSNLYLSSVVMHTMLYTLLYCLALLCTGSQVLAGELGDSDSVVLEVAGDSVVLELAGGEDESQGEVLLHGHPVCSVGWDERDATVACRMLG